MEIIVRKSARERDRAIRDRSAPANIPVSAVVRNQRDADELAYRLGRDRKPERPVLVDTGGTRTFVVGGGEASSGELQELVQHTIEKQAGQRKRTNTDLDFDALREKNGLMRREEVDPAIRNALRDRVAKHQADPVSDPARRFVYYPKV